MNRYTNRHDLPIEGNLRRAYRAPLAEADASEFQRLLARLRDVVDRVQSSGTEPKGDCCR